MALVATTGPAARPGERSRRAAGFARLVDRAASRRGRAAGRKHARAVEVDQPLELDPRPDDGADPGRRGRRPRPGAAPYVRRGRSGPGGRPGPSAGRCLEPARGARPRSRRGVRADQLRTPAEHQLVDPGRRDRRDRQRDAGRGYGVRDDPGQRSRPRRAGSVRTERAGRPRLHPHRGAPARRRRGRPGQVLRRHDARGPGARRRRPGPPRRHVPGRARPVARPHRTARPPGRAAVRPISRVDRLGAPEPRATRRRCPSRSGRSAPGSTPCSRCRRRRRPTPTRWARTRSPTRTVSAKSSSAAATAR